MKIQTGSFVIAGSNNTHVSKEMAASNAHKNNKTAKTGNQNNINTSLSVNSQFDKMIENIQEQIQKIQENDRYDADTKKSKIEELEKQLKEIEKVKAEQLNESILGLNKKSEKNNTNSVNKNANNVNKEANSNGVLVDISLDAKALLEADNNIKRLNSAKSTKVQLEGESKVLTSEIKIDKGRGVDTAKKEQRLEKIKEGVKKSVESMGESIKKINNTANEIPADEKQTYKTNSENSEDRAKYNNTLAKKITNSSEDASVPVEPV